MTSVPRTVGEVEGFVTMFLAACDDAGMNGTLETLLSQPDAERKTMVRFLLHKFRESGAPQSLIEAFVCLLDDDVAEKAYEVIYQCKRGSGSAS